MPSLEITQILLGGFAVLFSAGIQVLTGFGFSIVAIPLLLYILPSNQAVMVCMFLSMFTLILQARKNRSYARWYIIWRLIAVGFPGIILGVFIGQFINSAQLKGIVGLTIISYIVIQFLQNKRKRLYANSTDPLINEGSRGIPTGDCINLNTFPKSLYAAGALSGILTGVAGIPGPPVVAVLVQHLPKDQFHATSVNYFLIQYMIALSFSLLFFQNQYQLSILFFVLVLLIPTFVGYLIGHHIRKLINEGNFKKIVYGLLIVIGLTSILQVI